MQVGVCMLWTVRRRPAKCHALVLLRAPHPFGPVDRRPWNHPGCGRAAGSSAPRRPARRPWFPLRGRLPVLLSSAQVGPGVTVRV